MGAPTLRREKMRVGGESRRGDRRASAPPRVVRAREVDVAHALDADRSLGSLGTSFRVLPRPSDVRDGDDVSAAPTSIRAGRGLADDGTVANARTATSTNAWRRAVVCAPEGLFRCALASLAAREEETNRETLPETLEFDVARVDRARAEFRKIRLAAAWLLARARNSNARRARPRTGLRVRKRWPTLGVDSTRSSRTPPRTCPTSRWNWRRPRRRPRHRPTRLPSRGSTPRRSPPRRPDSDAARVRIPPRGANFTRGDSRRAPRASPRRPDAK